MCVQGYGASGGGVGLCEILPRIRRAQHLDRCGAPKSKFNHCIALAFHGDGAEKGKLKGGVYD